VQNLAVLSITAFVCYWAMRFILSFMFITAGLMLVSHRFLERLVALLLILGTLSCFSLIGSALFQPEAIDDLAGYAAVPVMALLLHRLLRELVAKRSAA
jgi:hypothetical protein